MVDKRCASGGHCDAIVINAKMKCRESAILLLRKSNSKGMNQLNSKRRTEFC